jgi:hypothetical protein
VTRPRRQGQEDARRQEDEEEHGDNYVEVHFILYHLKISHQISID